MKLILTNTSPPIEYKLHTPTTIIGSADDVDINLQGHKVAHYHAIIRHDGHMFSISSLDSRAPVQINGSTVVQGQTMWPGDEITLGDVKFIFHKDTTSETDTTSSPRPAPRPGKQDQSAPATNARHSPRLVPSSQIELKQLEALDAETLEMLRRKSPNLRPATGLTGFLKQGLAQSDSGQNKGIFGLLFTIPAISLTVYQKIRSKLTGSEEEAFPEGTWQFYTQFGLREDPGRHANETEGFQRAIPQAAREIDQAAAWVYQSIITLFEYETLLENEWVERTLLRLVHEAIAESVVERIARLEVGPDVRPDSPEFEAAKGAVWQNDIERIEIETEQVKQNLGLTNLAWSWVKKRPYRRPLAATETYPQYRRKLFLEFLAEAADRLPTQMGATIWDRYYELSSTALPAYQSQMSILYGLKPEPHMDEKTAIPLWQAKLGFIVNGRYYLLDVIHRDRQGRPLAFQPSKADDPGEPLALQSTEAGGLIDQLGRQISIDRKGNVTITDERGHSHIKVLHPIPPRQLKSQIAAILYESRKRPPNTSTVDLLLAQAPRARQPEFVALLPQSTRREIEQLNKVPIFVHWDQRDRAETLHKIRSDRRGLGNHALTIFRTASSFVFDQSHIFYDAIWGMMISQIITDGAVEAYRLMASQSLDPSVELVKPLRLMGNRKFQNAIDPVTKRIEMTAETDTADLQLISKARRQLSQLNIPITVNDFITFYRSLHDQLYIPSLTLQRALLNFRLEGNSQLADEIEANWGKRRKEPISLLLPMDASFVDPKLRLFPATFRNFLPEFSPLYERAVTLLDQITYNPTTKTQTEFLEVRGRLMANLLVLVEYFKMLKHVTRQGESLSTAAIKYLAHLPPGMQGTLDLIPQHVGALNEILKGEEVFSNVGRVSPTSSLVRFMSAKDDGASKVMVWGIMCDRDGTLKVTLRDFRPHVAKLLTLGREDLATLITHDYLEAYARGLNQFADDLSRIASTLT